MRPRFLADSMLGRLARWLLLMGYDTAYVDDSGATQFHPDVYRRDEQVLAALKAPFRFHPLSRRSPARS